MSEDSTERSQDPPESTASQETARNLGQVAGSNELASPNTLPAVLYLETTREGGEAETIRNRYKELLAKIAEDPKGEAALSLEEYCLFSVLRGLLMQGSVNTTMVGTNPPRRYHAKRIKGESKDDFATREVEMRRRTRDAFTDAYYFVMRPGLTAEQAAAVDAEVEARRQPLDRELREAAAAEAAEAENPTQPPTE